MTITANTFLSVNIGAAPNDGTGDPLRTAFTKLNDNFIHVTDTIWPNIQITRLTADVTSTYISTFNLLESDQIEASFIGNANTSFVGNTFSVNTFSINSFTSNVVTANLLTGELGTLGANAAFVTNLNATGTATANILVINNSITASSVNASNIGNVSAGRGFFTNVTSTNIADVRWIGRTIANELQSFRDQQLDFTYSSTASQYRILVLGNASVFVTNITYNIIAQGVERIVVFKNNASAASTRYINLPNDFNNLKQTNIAVSSTGSAFMHFVPFGTDAANVYVFIANI
jgi:hypothetical protein